MQRRLVFLVTITLCFLASVGCRSRRKVSPPQTAPPVVAAQPETPQVAVASPEREFQQPPASPEVLPTDTRELNRTARDRGWIRDAFFEFDASTLSASAQEALQTSARWLQSNAAYRVRIEGHCDERGTTQYNLALGERRASRAADYLATLGIDRSRIETVSYGEEHPFETGSDEAAWSQNRRAHLVLLSPR
jgi:peptidoglycan-associated lipoprotein